MSSQKHLLTDDDFMLNDDAAMDIFGGDFRSDQGFEADLDFREVKNVKFLVNGGMCHILRGIFRDEPVAVKVARDDCPQPSVARRDLETELKILSRMRHPSIIRVLGAGFVSAADVYAVVGGKSGENSAQMVSSSSRPRRFVLLEFLSHGTLAEMMGFAPPAPSLGMPTGPPGSALRYMRGSMPPPPSSTLPETRTGTDNVTNTLRMLELARQLAAAMHYLHWLSIPGHIVLHRDLKPENVGMQRERIKLFDFGLAKVLRLPEGRWQGKKYALTGQTGSMRYMAPEVALGLPYNEAADVYSFSIILWEMLTQTQAFIGLSSTEITISVVKGGRRPPILPEWDSGLGDMLNQCWSPNIALRPQFRTVEAELKEIALRISKSSSTTEEDEEESPAGFHEAPFNNPGLSQVQAGGATNFV